jgi:hypothetical protein
MEILVRYHVYWIFLIMIAIEALLVWQSGRKYSVSESVASFFGGDTWLGTQFDLSILDPY